MNAGSCPYSLRFEYARSGEQGHLLTGIASHCCYRVRVRTNKFLGGNKNDLQSIREEVKDDLLGRGYSRRQMMRAAMLFGGAATAFASARNWPAGGPKRRNDPDRPERMLDRALAPGAQGGGGEPSSQSNRYSPNNEHGQLVKVISRVEKMSGRSCLHLAGLQSALARSVLAFCSPTKGLVLADPSYETIVRAAGILVHTDEEGAAESGLQP